MAVDHVYWSVLGVRLESRTWHLIPTINMSTDNTSMNRQTGLVSLCSIPGIRVPCVLSYVDIREGTGYPDVFPVARAGFELYRYPGMGVTRYPPTTWTYYSFRDTYFKCLFFLTKHV